MHYKIHKYFISLCFQKKSLRGFNKPNISNFKCFLNFFIFEKSYLPYLYTISLKFSCIISFFILNNVASTDFKYSLFFLLITKTSFKVIQLLTYQNNSIQFESVLQLKYKLLLKLAYFSIRIYDIFLLQYLNEFCIQL